MPYRHTLIFDDSLNMLWKDYADRAVVDYRYNSSVKGSAQGCAAAMRVDLQVNAHAMHHISMRMHHASYSMRMRRACAVHDADADADARHAHRPAGRRLAAAAHGPGVPVGPRCAERAILGARPLCAVRWQSLRHARRGVAVRSPGATERLELRRRRMPGALALVGRPARRADGAAVLVRAGRQARLAQGQCARLRLCIELR
eukprot:scaffold65548_cov64-Phaeocystis_antarctica.AAC.2